MIEYIDMGLSVLTLTVAILLFRQVIGSNWDVLTSRIFLNNEQTQTAMKHFTQTFIAYTILMFISHIVAVFNIGAPRLIQEGLHVLSMLAMLGATVILYNIFSTMNTTEVDDTE